MDLADVTKLLRAANVIDELADDLTLAHTQPNGSWPRAEAKTRMTVSEYRSLAGELRALARRLQ
jgi:hypothetical protein